MEDYDVTTLPDGYEPLVPSGSGGFRVFVVVCCVVILYLGGIWLTGKFVRGNTVIINEATVSPYETQMKDEHSPPGAVYTETFELRTKDGVLVGIEARTRGAKLSFEAKTALHIIMVDIFYKDIPHNRAMLQDWADQNGIDKMTLMSKTPLVQEPESKGGGIREDLIKEGPGGTNE